MTRLAFAGDPRVRVDDREMRRGGVSYTVDTLETLHQEHPKARLRLLLGGDQALNFGSWREPARIEALAEPVVVPRPPLRAAALRDELVRRTGNAAWVKRVLDIEPVETSSTDVRAMLARGERPGPDLLLPAVADYAMRHGLYRADAR
jgi:nicotinate-nucleotide adenylyltransferase